MGKRRSRLASIALLTTVFVLLVAPAAHAYIDPASGSQVIQFLVAGVAGAAAAVAVFWGRISDFFTKLFRR